ncbi:CRAL-TRIO domain-containing protein [Dactylonectria estremocensis]|uniref:CRAL-TRIO domain-containing protein n=1 Tax=Dactylonectria estremocensis TaxID=1079267 RepID=A0A9P9E1P4_9HYPO|nr:CRAL-TRIO domain-containing protein [Dactylonectria estremocensis]
MTPSAELGTLDNLTISQELKLQNSWVYLLRLHGTEGFVPGRLDKSDEFRQSLNNKSPESFRHTLWNSIVADHPDATILRFLRARNWDVEKAMAMITSAIDWREERRVDEDIIRKGEGVGLKASLTADDEAFITQYRSGKSYVRGTDKEGYPVYIIRARLHDPHLQSAEAMETYTLHNIETIRMMARSPHDKACLIFDLSGFGLRNMDFHVVKFLIHVLEARYPETLGSILIYDAPFVFWGLWSVIKRWLDPVVVSKIHFTSGKEDLTRFIPKDHLQTRYGGNDKWEYNYIDPVPGENELVELEEKRAEIQAERNDLLQQFDLLTIEWACLEPGSAVAKEKVIERDHLVKQIQSNYWKLDPYIRARTYYHRAGVVNAACEADFKAAI